MNREPFGAAIITGHSVPGCTGLSAVQLEFQRLSLVPPDRWLGCNFPYMESDPFPSSVPLLRASFNNLAHYLASRKPGFPAVYRDPVHRVLDRFDQILLVAGSCGLELFNNLGLPGEIRSRIHLFAYGPVSRSLPEVASFRLVQGDRDWISRIHHRRVPHRIPCGHLGYLEHPETLRLFNEFYLGLERR